MSRTILIGLFFLGVIMIFLYVNMKGEKFELYNNRFERTFSNISVVKGATFEYEGDLNNPKIVGSDLCFKRYDNQTIVCISKNGEVKRSWGTVDTTSVNKLAFVISWEFDSAGLTLVDGRLNSVYRFNLAGDFIEEKKLPVKATRALTPKPGVLVIKTPDPKDENNEIYKQIELTTGTSTDLEFDLPNVEHADFTLDGFFINNSRTNFHICYKTGMFFAFDDNGQFLYRTKTVDETGTPIVKVSAEGAKRYHPLTQRINRSAFATEKKLFILSGRKALNETADGDVIDIYNSNTGQYTSSFVIPYLKNEGALDIFGNDTELFIIYPKYVVQYAINETR